MINVLMIAIFCLTGVSLVGMFLLSASSKDRSELTLKAKSKDFEGHVNIKSENDAKK